MTDDVCIAVSLEADEEAFRRVAPAGATGGSPVALEYVLAGDVHTLCGIAIAVGVVLSAVDDSGHGFDTQVAIVQR